LYQPKHKDQIFNENVAKVLFNKYAQSQLSGDIAFSPDGGVPALSQLSSKVAFSPEASSQLPGNVAFTPTSPR
jgi:hypothetical protein